MKIVFTDIKTLGFNLDISCLNKFGEVRIYDEIPHEDIGKLLLSEAPDTSVIVTNASRLGSHNLKDLQGLKLICEAGTGYDNIDVDYCKSIGIGVTNVPGYSGNSVAQFTFSMLFYLLSNSRYYDEYVKSAAYSKEEAADYSANEFFELAGKTWGIIGMGDIGTRVAKYARAFGCNTISYSARENNPNHSNRRDNNCEEFRKVSLDQFLAKSDVVSIHAPLTPLTRNLITIKELEQMKPSSILLNLGRGGIVNEADLAMALNNNIISAAGLDVFEKEPPDISNPLLNLNDPGKICLSPHIAFGSVEARQRLVAEVCKSISSFIDGGNYNRVDL